MKRPSHAVHDPNRFASLHARAHAMNCTLSWVDHSPNGGGGLYVLHDPGRGVHHGRIALDDMTTVVVALERAARSLHHGQKPRGPGP